MFFILTTSTNIKIFTAKFEAGCLNKTFVLKIALKNQIRSFIWFISTNFESILFE